jgi:carbon monoxide dehydrogenase subunit G
LKTKQVYKIKNINMATVKKSGGSLSGLKASNKRVGPVDPQGAWTKVQQKTLAKAKGKAKLTPDKELGATKMKSKAKSK